MTILNPRDIKIVFRRIMSDLRVIRKLTKLRLRLCSAVNAPRFVPLMPSLRQTLYISSLTSG
jgi:hypothetical protein